MPAILSVPTVLSCCGVVSLLSVVCRGAAMRWLVLLLHRVCLERAGVKRRRG